MHNIEAIGERLGACVDGRIDTTTKESKDLAAGLAASFRADMMASAVCS